MKIKFMTAYEECRDDVYGYLLYMTREKELAEDLSQETFLKMFLHMGKFRGECSLRTWVLKIARNTFLSYATKKQPVLLEEQEIEQEKADKQSEPETEILRMETGEYIRSVLMALREEERSILLLCDYEELTYEEIAEITGISKDAVKGRIYRARQKFQRLYQNAGGGYGK